MPRMGFIGKIGEDGGKRSATKVYDQIRLTRWQLDRFYGTKEVRRRPDAEETPFKRREKKGRRLRSGAKLGQ